MDRGPCPVAEEMKQPGKLAGVSPDTSTNRQASAFTRLPAEVLSGPGPGYVSHTQLPRQPRQGAAFVNFFNTKRRPQIVNNLADR